MRKQAQARSLTRPFRQEHISEEEMSICDKVFNLEKALIEEAQNMLDPNVFNNCVNKLISANNVMVIGGSVSDYVAQYFVRIGWTYHFLATYRRWGLSPWLWSSAIPDTPRWR